MELRHNQCRRNEAALFVILAEHPESALAVLRANLVVLAIARAVKSCTKGKGLLYFVNLGHSVTSTAVTVESSIQSSLKTRGVFSRMHTPMITAKLMVVNKARMAIKAFIGQRLVL